MGNDITVEKIKSAKDEVVREYTPGQVAKMSDAVKEIYDEKMAKINEA